MDNNDLIDLMGFGTRLTFKLRQRVSESNYKLNKTEAKLLKELPTKLYEAFLGGSLLATIASIAAVVHYMPNRTNLGAPLVVCSYVSAGVGMLVYRESVFVKDVLDLEYSPVREELMAILQEDFPKSSYLKLARTKLRMDSNLNSIDPHPLPRLLPTPAVTEPAITVGRISSEEGLPSGIQQEARSDQEANLQLLDDFFDSFPLGALGGDDSSKPSLTGSQAKGQQSRRSSQMSKAERREFNRQRYQIWQAKRAPGTDKTPKSHSDSDEYGHLAGGPIHA